jgi:hypothetical protein
MVCGGGQAKNQMCRPIEKNLLDLLTSGFPLADLLLHSTAIPCWGSLRKSAVVVNNQAGARSGLMQRAKGRESRPPRRYILNGGGRVDLLFTSSMAALILWDFPPSLKAESRHTFAFILSLQDYFHRFLINLGLSVPRPHPSSDVISDSKPCRDNSFLTAGTCASAPQVSGGGYYAEMDQYVSEYKIHQWLEVQSIPWKRNPTKSCIVLTKANSVCVRKLHQVRNLSSFARCSCIFAETSVFMTALSAQILSRSIHNCPLS